MLVALIVGLGSSVGIFLSNVVFPSRTDDNPVGILAFYLVAFAAFILTGALAARRDAGRTGQLLAGAIAGALVGALIVAAFAIADNVWLNVVSQQQSKIDGLAHSGAASMCDYINQGPIGPAVFFTVVLGVLGAALSLFGGAISHARAAHTSVRPLNPPR